MASAEEGHQQNTQKQAGREPAGCQEGGQPGAPGRAVPRWGCHSGQEGPVASGRNCAQKVTLRSVFLALEKERSQQIALVPCLFRHEGDTRNVQNVLEKRPAPVRVRCRVITGLSQESWGRQLLLTVPPQGPPRARRIEVPRMAGGAGKLETVRTGCQELAGTSEPDAAHRQRDSCRAP